MTERHSSKKTKRNDKWNNLGVLRKKEKWKEYNMIKWNRLDFLCVL